MHQANANPEEGANHLTFSKWRGIKQRPIDRVSVRVRM
jgi:hypothetical protein